MQMRVAERIKGWEVPRGSVAIWWLGQNSYLLQGPSTVIMVDPYFSRPGPREKYVHEEAPLRADEIGPEAVFCTHNHSDHTDPDFLSALSQHWPAARFYGPAESAEAMRGAGIPGDRVTPVQAGDVVRSGEVSALALLSKTPQVSDVAHYGYVLQIAGAPKVYDTGDIMRGVTREPSLMDPLRATAPEVALVTTSPTEVEFPDFSEAAALAREIGARVVIPAHYGCFARRTFDPARFAAQVGSGGALRPVIIPYCDVYQHPPAA